jgi:hypothetical protein
MEEQTIITTLALAILLAMTFIGVSNILFYLLIRKKEIQQKQLFDKVLEMKDAAIKELQDQADELYQDKKDKEKTIEMLNRGLLTLRNKVEE